MITPGSVNPLLMCGDTTTPCGGVIDTPTYVIKNSLRFRGGQHLSYTAPTRGNLRAWVFSAWVKLSATQQMALFTSKNNPNWGGGATAAQILIDGQSHNHFQDLVHNGGVTYDNATSTVFRDYSAFYHFVYTYDSNNATPSERLRLFVNGQRVAFDANGSTIPQGRDSQINNNQGPHFIGALVDTTQFFDGYMADIHFIDGQALDATSFGEFDSNNVWRPKAYAGTYGTNGFWLKFDDAAQIGKDSSGNNNHWTPHNIDVAAPGTQATYDLMKDSPVMFDDGTPNPPGNYATLNALCTPGGMVLSAGNLGHYKSSGPSCTPATMNPSSGKYFFDLEYSNAQSAQGVGLGISLPNKIPYNNYLGAVAGSCCLWRVTSTQSLTIYSDGRSINPSDSIATSDVMVAAIDCDAGKLWLGKFNVSTNVTTWYSSTGAHTGNPVAGTNETYTFPAGVPIAPCVTNRDGGGVIHANFGQRPFKCVPPTGFKALCTTNLPTPSITNGKQHFDIALGAGAGILAQAQALTPHDLIWIKRRDGSSDHEILDSARGSTNALRMNRQDGQSAYAAQAGNAVAWAWAKSKCSGFDVVTYTGTGANRSVPHVCGVPLGMVFIKRVDSSTHWYVWQNTFGPNSYMTIDSASGISNDATIFAGTPTSTDVLLGNNAAVNAAGGNYVMYCWGNVPGFSHFGVYQGGVSDGPFLYLGFRPRMFLVKKNDGAGSWIIYDGAREPYNEMHKVFYPDDTSSEEAGVRRIDFVSNGVKIRTGTGSDPNRGSPYFYAAWAEHPFKISLAR